MNEKHQEATTKEINDLKSELKTVASERDEASLGKDKLAKELALIKVDII